MRSSAQPARTSTGAAAETPFLRARVASFFGIVPLGVWTALHLWHNLAAFQGPSAWQDAVTGYEHPLGFLLAGVVVLIPLALHTIWGVGRLFTSRPNVVRYGFYANLKYVLQRLSAIGVLFFLGAHLWLAMISPRLAGHPEPFAEIAHEMRHHGPTLVVYLLGTLGVSYHLANGLSSFAMGWGIVSTRHALRRLEWVVLATFAALLAMAWGAIYGLWQAGQ